MSADTVLTREKIEEIAEAVYEKDQFPNTDEVWCNLYWLSSFAKAVEQSVLQSPEIQALRKDAERLDSGCIITNERNDFGEEYTCERRGIDLRAAIDAAMEKQP